jgi:hypothetical protein
VAACLIDFQFTANITRRKKNAIKTFSILIKFNTEASDCDTQENVSL